MFFNEAAWPLFDTLHIYVYTYIYIMWVKQCHKPPIWEWFIPPIYGDLGDGSLLFYPH